MIALLRTAERAGDTSQKNTYILSRHMAAYCFAKKMTRGNVPELGCGNGMKLLASQCTTYTGIDKFVNSGHRVCANTAIFKGLLPDLGNVGDNFYDVVICFQVIEHIRDDRKLIKEIYRVLRPGGQLLLTTPNAPCR